MFTKQHYGLIADILERASRKEHHNVHNFILNEFISLFTEDNSRFDEDKFLIASGAEAIVLWRYHALTLKEAMETKKQNEKFWRDICEDVHVCEYFDMGTGFAPRCPTCGNISRKAV